MSSMNRLRGLRALLEDAVEHGTTAVERVHRATAARPFDILDLIARRAGGARRSPVHDATVAGVYETIRQVEPSRGRHALGGDRSLRRRSERDGRGDAEQTERAEPSPPESASPRRRPRRRVEHRLPERMQRRIARLSVTVAGSPSYPPRGFMARFVLRPRQRVVLRALGDALFAHEGGPARGPARRPCRRVRGAPDARQPDAPLRPARDAGSHPVAAAAAAS